jgi:hypothetical protein
MIEPKGEKRPMSPATWHPSEMIEPLGQLAEPLTPLGSMIEPKGARRLLIIPRKLV